MSLARWIVTGILVMEGLAGGWLAVVRLLEPRVPMPVFEGTNEFTQMELRQQAAACRTAAAWREMGEAYLATGFFREAEACQRVACQREPSNARFAFEWAFALERLGELERANELYSLAATLGYEHPDECHYFIGRNLLRQVRVDEAQRAFERAGELPAARYARAKIHWDLQEAAAESITDQLLAQHASALQPLWLKQRITAGRNDQAAHKYRDRWELCSERLHNPFDRDVLRLTARNHSLGLPRRVSAAEGLLAAENYQAAEAAFADILQVRWNSAAADQRADALFQLSRKKEALALLLEMLERDGPTVSTLERLGDAHSDLGKEREARQAWERAVRLGPGTTAKDACFKLGYSYEKASEPAKAQPWLAQGNCSLGMELMRQQNYGDARIMLGRAVKLDPESSRAWFQVGELERLLGSTAEALAAYRQCIRLEPTHGKCSAALAGLESGS